MTTRFAPSPTGYMHFGNLRTALFNYLLSKKNSEDFILRIEDTDKQRSEEKYTDSILEDLQWLGISWSSVEKQSARSDVYENYYKQLIEKKLAYPCFCKEETLKAIRKSQLSQGIPPRYPGTCYNLTEEEINKKIESGLKPALRFRVNSNDSSNEIISFTDLIKGPQKFFSKDLGDFIIRRQTGDPAFMFCNAIDDAEMGIDKALRGEDHLSNVPRQLLILKALNLNAPQYGHFPMINGMDGAPLSKRNGSESVKDLREQGFHPQALVNYLSRLGHFIRDNRYLSIAEIAENFDLKDISGSVSAHDKMHLKHWQKEAMLHSSLDSIFNLLDKKLQNKIDSLQGDKKNLFLEILQQNILMPSEANTLYISFFNKKLEYSLENKEIINNAGDGFFELAKKYIQDNRSNIEKIGFEFKSLVNYLKINTDKQGKSLFMPLRVALTNQSHGPEMDKITKIMGIDLIIARFNDCTNNIIMDKDKTGRRI